MRYKDRIDEQRQEARIHKAIGIQGYDWVSLVRSLPLLVLDV
jgi:hypothetical protein